jgi:HEAT repeat protein
MARGWLAEHQLVDVAAFYRRAVATGEKATLVPAIAGLAEVGKAEDAADLVFLTDHPRAKVREAVAVGLSRLLAAEAINALVPMLADASPRVARKAQRLLERYVSSAIAPTVWKLIESVPPQRASSAIRLLSELPKWEALEYLLRAINRPEPTRTESAALLQRWRDLSVKMQRPLGSADARRLRERLAALPEGLLPYDVIRSVEFELTFWADQGT